MNTDEYQARLERQLLRIQELERQLREQQRDLELREQARKQVLLRLAPTLWQQIASWAEQDFRSINGQIEYILTRAVQERQQKKS